MGVGSLGLRVEVGREGEGICFKNSKDVIILISVKGRAGMGVAESNRQTDIHVHTCK